MFQYYCLNPISKVGLANFTDGYAKTEALEEAQGVLVRSASMHEMELPKNLLESTISLWISARNGVSWCSIRPVPTLTA